MASLRPPKDPIIAVIGATGTGKSKLAVEIATRFNGEIINSDAMQMYKGLPVITNKVTEKDKNGIPHHLLDTLELDEEPWTVWNFVREAQKVVKEIRGRGRLPIVVGGTGYYVRALLLRDSMLDRPQDKDNENRAQEGKPFEQEQEHSNANGHQEAQFLGQDNGETSEDLQILSRPTEEIYAKLQGVDPDMASRWHPRDRRKIQRSLEIYLRSGRKASEVYQEQKIRSLREPTYSVQEGDCADGGDSTSLRYPLLIFWLAAEDSILKERLNDRVYEMIVNGMLQEAVSMASLDLDLAARGTPPDKSKGIWVSIGYKELEGFLKSRDTVTREDPTLPEPVIEAIQAATRQYAKRQNRYIRIHLFNALRDANAAENLFLLDGTDLTQRQSFVTDPSLRLVETFLDGNHLPEPSSLNELAKSTFSAMHNAGAESQRFHGRTCDVCQKVLMTEKEWNGHLSSRGHRKAVAGQRKRDENESMRNAAETEEATVI